MQRSRALVCALLLTALLATGCAGTLGHGKNIEKIGEAIQSADPRIEKLRVKFEDEGGGNYGTVTVVDLVAPELYSASAEDRTRTILKIVHDAQVAADFSTSWSYHFWTAEEWATEYREAPTIDARALFGPAFPAAMPEDAYDGTFEENLLSLDDKVVDGRFAEEILWLVQKNREPRAIADTVRATDSRITAVSADSMSLQVNDGPKQRTLELQVTVPTGTELSPEDLRRTISAAVTARPGRYHHLVLEYGAKGVGPIDLVPAATRLFGAPGQDGVRRWSVVSLRYPNPLPDRGIRVEDPVALLRLIS